ncbi:MAG: 30S ribosomal protein S9 [Planctomycetota bacterium]|nr:MAG: 30S ribosomal protein S9 [Planctomycetota bacterium]
MEERTDKPADEEVALQDPEAVGEEAEEQEPEVDPTGRVVEPGPRSYHWGTGRRKSARARVRIRPGSGDFVINGRPLKEYFPREVDRLAATGPLRCIGVLGKVDVYVNAEGGGITGQAGAVRLGVSRALLKLYPDALQRLREAGHLTRDPRMVERKKYGLRGARRAFQWVKR